MIENILLRLRGRPKILPFTEPVNDSSSRNLEQGSCYLIKESQPEMSLEIFCSLVKGKCAECDHPEAFPCESIGCELCTLICPCKQCRQARAQGLCLTMRFPEEIRREYAFQTTPIIWISNHGQDCVRPSDMEIMAEIVKKFLERSKNPVVLLDGIEYLIIVNGFVPAIKFLRDVQEEIMLRNGLLILPVNLLAIEKKELAIIERISNEISLD